MKKEHHANYYSPQGELLEFGEMGLEPKPDADLLIPDNLQDMIALAEQLSKSEPFIRVDLYNVNGKIYFGELTFYPASGLLPWSPSHYDYDLGNLLILSTQ